MTCPVPNHRVVTEKLIAPVDVLNLRREESSDHFMRFPRLDLQASATEVGEIDRTVETK